MRKAGIHSAAAQMRIALMDSFYKAMKQNVSSHGEPWSVDIDAPVLFPRMIPVTPKLLWVLCLAFLCYGIPKQLINDL